MLARVARAPRRPSSAPRCPRAADARRATETCRSTNAPRSPNNNKADLVRERPRQRIAASGGAGASTVRRGVREERPNRAATIGGRVPTVRRRFPRDRSGLPGSRRRRSTSRSRRRSRTSCRAAAAHDRGAADDPAGRPRAAARAGVGNMPAVLAHGAGLLLTSPGSGKADRVRRVPERGRVVALVETNVSLRVAVSRSSERRRRGRDDRWRRPFDHRRHRLPRPWRWRGCCSWRGLWRGAIERAIHRRRQTPAPAASGRKIRRGSSTSLRTASTTALSNATCHTATGRWSRRRRSWRPRCAGISAAAVRNSTGTTVRALFLTEAATRHVDFSREIVSGHTGSARPTNS